jgi:hypothetical protein
MGLKTESRFREPISSERALLADLRVRTIDEDGGLELESQIEGKAPVVKRIPVEAEGKDRDGTTIHMLLHVKEGRPVELEFFREDGVTVKTMPQPSDFELIVMPPAPKDGWAYRGSSGD